MNTAVEAYAEKMVRDEWMRKLREHGEAKCPECGHSGYTHGMRGCVAFKDDVPTKIIPQLGKVVDIPDGGKMEDWQCGCQSGLCKTNEQIIFGYDLPEVRNEPLSQYEGK